METMTYAEIKAFSVEDYDVIMKEEDFCVAQTIAALLENSIFVMKGSKKEYSFVIVAAAYVSVQHGIMPAYLYDRLLSLQDTVTCMFEEEEFTNDYDEVLLQIKHKKVEIEEDTYRYRLEMLMPIAYYD